MNRGMVGQHALGRVDVEKLRLSAEDQTNWLPYVIGPMQFRPGLGYVGETLTDQKARMIPFIFSKTDTALLEFTASVMRVWKTGSTLIVRPAVTATVTNGDFAGAGSWTLTMSPDSTGASSAISSNQLTLSAIGRGAYAQATQQVTVNEPNVVHALRIVVSRGPITFRCGSTSGGTDYIAETTLNTGTHSLAFTPTGSSFYLQFEQRAATQVIVTSCQIESSGTLTLPTPYVLANLYDSNSCSQLRYAQSGDVVYIACDGLRPRKIERRDNDSWSITLYQPDNGPLVGQTTAQQEISLSCNTTEGNGTLTASSALFVPEDVGQLFYLFNQGQNQAYMLSAADHFTNAISVTGVGADRTILYDVTGTWGGTLYPQRSYVTASSGFVDIPSISMTVNTKSAYAVSSDNVNTWFRIGFKTSSYSSGNAIVTFPVIGLVSPTLNSTSSGDLNDPAAGGGGGAGIVRVTAYSSSTSVSVEVTQYVKSTQATKDWKRSEWSDDNTWPTAVGFFDGRIWWSSKDKIWGSVSDEYENFDVDKTGDSAPINRSVGFGPIGVINWILPLTRMIVGRDMSETAIRSSAFDEPVTPTNFTLKDCSTQGSNRVQAVKIDSRGVFVQQSQRKVYELAYNAQIGDYASRDLTRLNLDIGENLFTQMAVQRQPDTMIHFVDGAGEVAALVYDSDDAVEAWWKITTNGTIEDVVVLPGDLEDSVYYVVARTINGSTKRYLEKFARRDVCIGGTLNKNMDSHIVVSQASSTTVTGLSTLEGSSVVVWGNGKDLGTFTVSGGQITGLSEAVTSCVVGLSYDATFKSAKLAYAAQKGTALTQTKRVDKLGFVLVNTHYQGVQYGPDSSHLNNLPKVELSQTTATDTVWTTYDQMQFSFSGTYDTDSRIYFKASSPRPATILGAVIGIRTDED